MDAIVAALEQGGHLFYIGAGTSGRLGVLDASECPPTFNVPPELVQGIIAGGERALSRATEDQRRRSGSGCARSAGLRDSARATCWWGSPPAAGRPMCWARWPRRASLGAITCGISCTPDSELSRAVDYPIEPMPGPEVVAGSTRLRAGTATKLVLNMLSTAVMIRLGYVYGNLMVNVQPKNEKLVDRARRIIARPPAYRRERAAELLTAGGNSVRTAIVMEKTRVFARRKRSGCWPRRAGGFGRHWLHLDKFVIQGGTPLEGEIAVSGSKNSALPALAACLLTEEPVMLDRIPPVRDIRTMERLLVDIGARVTVDGERVTVEADAIENAGGALRTGEDHARVEPGAGSAGGALRARARVAAGRLRHRRAAHQSARRRTRTAGRARSARSTATSKPKRRTACDGAEVHFDRITVTGTEDLHDGRRAGARRNRACATRRASRKWSTWRRCSPRWARRSKARAPPPSASRASRSCTAREHTIIADRIEAGTFLIAGAITGGDLTVTGCEPEHLRALDRQAAAGGRGGDASRRRARCACARRPKLRSVDMTTEEYPGFATDLQAQYMALMTQAEGIAIITETIFENRFMHAQELARMGANIRLDGRQAIVAGPQPLTGAQVIASDLRASASLVLAAWWRRAKP